jgi:hypothetical protein
MDRRRRKNAAFFLGLEKTRQKKKAMNALYDKLVNLQLIKMR